MKKILVTGANGQLGQELQRLKNDFKNFQFVFFDKNNLNISDEMAVKNVFNSEKPNFCINAAAYTAVDKAENEPEKAYLINAQAVQILATQCAENQCVLIHISTDYVYHNQENRPLKPTDFCNPQGVYAQTKLAGENLALRYCQKTIIVRTSWVYSIFGSNFVKTMLKLAAERNHLNIVSDQIGSPTNAEDLAYALVKIVQVIDNQPYFNRFGIYQYSNEGVCSWYDLAAAIFEISALNCEVNPIFTHEYPTPAQRPSYSVLDKSEIKQVFALRIPHWRESLQKCLFQLQK
jgi:dTDP-4-dehydrorhamnose reductase